MQSELLSALRARHLEIRSRWAELLRVEPVNTPLAHPEALAHLIDWTLEEIFHELATATARWHADSAGERRVECPCGRNPLLAYFSSAGQVLQEALILLQASMPTLDPLERDAALSELKLVLRSVANREIEAFCGVCQHRLQAAGLPPCTAVNNGDDEQHPFVHAAQDSKPSAHS